MFSLIAISMMGSHRFCVPLLFRIVRFITCLRMFIFCIPCQYIWQAIAIFDFLVTGACHFWFPSHTGLPFLISYSSVLYSLLKNPYVISHATVLFIYLLLKRRNDYILLEMFIIKLRVGQFHSCLLRFSLFGCTVWSI